MVLFCFLVPLGSVYKKTYNANKASLLGPSSICCDRSNKAQVPTWCYFCLFVLFCFSKITDSIAKEKRVRQALRDWTTSPYPTLSVRGDSHPSGNGRNTGHEVRGSERNPLDLPTEQSGPIQLGSQLQRPVSGRYVPCPLHWSGHWTLASSQLRPPQPGLQRHSPFTQTPWLEQVGSKQSTEKRHRGKVMISTEGTDLRHKPFTKWTSGSPIVIHLQTKQPS